jgi:hypothetical protein
LYDTNRPPYTECIQPYTDRPFGKPEHSWPPAQRTPHRATPPARDCRPPNRFIDDSIDFFIKEIVLLTEIVKAIPYATRRS